MWRRFTGWLGRTFGAAPTDAGPEQMVVVFEGDPGECQIVALRLRSAGFFVQPDPTPRHNGFSNSSVYQSWATRMQGVASHTVSVLATDEARARVLLDAIEPI